MSSKTKPQTIELVINKYNELFKINWINQLPWSSTTAKKSYIKGCNIIDEFISFFFINICNSLLKGEFLYNTLDDKIEYLCTICQDETLTEGSTLKQKLQDRFINLNNNLYDVLTYYRLCLQSIQDKIDLAEHSYIVNAVSRHSQTYTFNLLELTHRAIDICFREYELSYDEDYIRFLILQKDAFITIVYNCTNEAEKNIMNAVLYKIDFLLFKLSHFSENNKIEYYLNFKSQSINASNISSRDRHSLYSTFRYFMKPNSMPNSVILEAQMSCYQKKASAWQMVLLMRYYTKVSKSKQQVNNLIEQYNDFYIQKIRDGICSFNIYSLKTIKNYMYNSLLSFMIDNKAFAHEEIIDILKHIICLQKETSVHNFHPYQKAIPYLIEHIRTNIRNDIEFSIIYDELEYLFVITEKLDESYKWCRTHQFYPFQLMREDCNIPIKEDKLNIILFTPSSFSRPIKYEQLFNTIASLKLDVEAIKNEVKLYEEHSKIMIIKKEMEKSKRTQSEIFGIFAAVLTFFIGCLTVFTNIDKNISIIDKIEHISYLGVILLMFISTGYFFVTDNLKQNKTWIFGIMTLMYIVILVKVFFIS